MVSIEHVSKRYGNNLVLDDINLKFDDKEFICIVGQSGCGKTTLLKIIGGLISYEGKININDNNNLKESTAMVFQDYVLFPSMKVIDNILFNLDKKSYHEKVIKLASVLSISHLLNRYPSELSGGETQRVAIARAIIRDPKLLLLDEPLSHLDQKLKIDLRKLVKKIYLNNDQTFIYVTHDEVEALTLATKIVIIRDGKVEEVNTPDNIINNPKNLYVASFFGKEQLNILKGKVKHIDNSYYIEYKNLLVKVDTFKGISKYCNKDVYFTVRSNDIYYDKEGIKQEILEEEQLFLENKLYLEDNIVATLNKRDKSYININFKKISNIFDIAQEKNIELS